MKDNVLIKVYERGKLKRTVEGHNVWLDAGRAYLASILAYTTIPGLATERTDRIRYMGLGIGGVGQADANADLAPLTTSYPAGFDPNATNGHQYDKTYPVLPPITTLERPVRVSGGTNPYNTAPPSDQWLITNTFPTHTDTTTSTLHAVVDANAGDVLLGGSFSSMPLSEAALYTSSADIHAPFNVSTLAYFSFGTIHLNPSTVLELVWSARF